MFGSTSLEVATGLVFVFLLLSVLVTAATELVSAVLNSRAKTLWKGISALLEDSNTQAVMGRSWTAQLYAHPIIRPLLPLATQTREEKLGPKGKGPSYIPSRSFAIALLDITKVTNPGLTMWQHRLEALLGAIPPGDGQTELVRQAVQDLANEIGGALDGQQLKADLQDLSTRLTRSSSGQISRIADNIKGETLDFLKPLLLELSKNPDAGALENIIQQVPTADAEAADVRNRLQALLPRLTTGSDALATAKIFAQSIAGRAARQALAKLDNEDLKGALLKLLDEAHGDVDKLKDHVEIWFNHSMERVKGWYKRYTVAVHLIVATVLAIFMNVDALVVMQHLSADPALRQSLLTEADGYAKKAAATPTATPAPAPAATQPLRLTVPAPAGDADAGGATTSANESGGAAMPKATPAPKPPADADELAEIKQANSSFQKVQGQLLGLGLPIGWSLPKPLPKPAPAGTAAAATDKTAATPGAATPGGRGKVATPTTEPVADGATHTASTERTGDGPDEFRTLPHWPLLFSLDGGDEWKRVLDTLQFHAIGWLLSIVAASLGAPFWFDTLKTFVNIRATGHPPEPTVGGSKPPARPAA